MGEIQTLAETASCVGKNGGKKILVLFCDISNSGDGGTSKCKYPMFEVIYLFMHPIFLQSLRVRHQVRLQQEQSNKELEFKRDLQARQNDVGTFNMELAPETMDINQFSNGQCQEETISPNIHR